MTQVAGIDPADDEIVVVGMGMAVAGANSPEEFWRELLDGAERFIEVPADRWDNDHFHSADRKAVDKTCSRHSAFITGFQAVEGAEPAAVGEGEIPEYTASWLRQAVVQSLQGVGRSDDDAVSLFVGYTADGSHHLEEASVVAGVHAHGDQLVRTAAPSQEEADRRLALLDSVLAARYPRSGPRPERYLPHRTGREAVRGILGEDADVVMVDTACSSSLYTIDLGIKAIREGRSDVAVAGGAFALAPRGSILFAKLNGLSAKGEVRSLDADGDGVLFADGAAAVVLKTRSRADADGDRILASIASIGSSSDGKGKAIYAPKAEGQKLAIERTQAGHDLEPAWVVAHATGTPAGDLAEYSTLRDLYGERAVPISSNKSIVGHTGWAAGAVSVIEAILGLQNETIPPQHPVQPHSRPVRGRRRPADRAQGADAPGAQRRPAHGGRLRVRVRRYQRARAPAGPAGRARAGAGFAQRFGGRAHRDRRARLTHPGGRRGLVRRPVPAAAGHRGGHASRHDASPGP